MIALCPTATALSFFDLTGVYYLASAPNTGFFKLCSTTPLFSGLSPVEWTICSPIRLYAVFPDLLLLSSGPFS